MQQRLDQPCDLICILEEDLIAGRRELMEGSVFSSLDDVPLFVCMKVLAAAQSRTSQLSTSDTALANEQ